MPNCICNARTTGFDTSSLRPAVWIGGETEALQRLERHLERKVNYPFMGNYVTSALQNIFSSLKQFFCFVDFSRLISLWKIIHCVNFIKAWIASFGRPRMTSQSLLASTTGLSPYLRFGCLSARLFYHALGDLYRKVRGKKFFFC